MIINEDIGFVPGAAAGNTRRRGMVIICGGKGWIDGRNPTTEGIVGMDSASRVNGRVVLLHMKGGE